MAPKYDRTGKSVHEQLDYLFSVCDPDTDADNEDEAAEGQESSTDPDTD